MHYLLQINRNSEFINPANLIFYFEDPQLSNDGVDKSSESKRQIAIALKQDKTTKTRPTVKAKGHGDLAEKILRLAFDNDIKVRTDPELAEILSVVEIDCEIPLEAIAAVAEILRHVYETNKTSFRFLFFKNLFS